MGCCFERKLETVDREGHRKETTAQAEKVKTCGKSTRGQVAISGVDKPCGLKCQVYLNWAKAQQSCSLCFCKKVGEGRQMDPARKNGTR